MSGMKRKIGYAVEKKRWIERTDGLHHPDSPLFQLYSFLNSTCPLGLKGPFSEKAPTPSDEQPGPARPMESQKGSEEGVDDKTNGIRAH
jgi:hypothetical protein